MSIDTIAQDKDTIIGRVTGQRRVVDDASLLFAALYAAAIKNGVSGVTCPECLTQVVATSAIDDVPTGKKDMYGCDEYASGFHCRVCEYTTTQWPSERS